MIGHSTKRHSRLDRASRKLVRILDDGTSTNETRLGAVRDLILAIEAFKQKQTSMIMCHHEPALWKLQRTGVIAVDTDMRVLQMQEKPAEPVSHLAVPPFYIYRKEDLPLIRTAIENGCGADAPATWPITSSIALRSMPGSCPSAALTSAASTPTKKRRKDTLEWEVRRRHLLRRRQGFPHSGIAIRKPIIKKECGNQDWQDVARTSFFYTLSL